MVSAGYAVDLWISHVSVRAGKVGRRRAGSSVDTLRIVDRARVIADLQALVVRSCDARRGALRGHGSASKACRSDGGYALCTVGRGDAPAV